MKEEDVKPGLKVRICGTPWRAGLNGEQCAVTNLQLGTTGYIDADKPVMDTDGNVLLKRRDGAVLGWVNVACLAPTDAAPAPVPPAPAGSVRGIHVGQRVVVIAGTPWFQLDGARLGSACRRGDEFVVADIDADGDCNANDGRYGTVNVACLAPAPQHGAIDPNGNYTPYLGHDVADIAADLVMLAEHTRRTWGASDVNGTTMLAEPGRTVQEVVTSWRQLSEAKLPPAPVTAYGQLPPPSGPRTGGSMKWAPCVECGTTVLADVRENVPRCLACATRTRLQPQSVATNTSGPPVVPVTYSVGAVPPAPGARERLRHHASCGTRGDDTGASRRGADWPGSLAVQDEFEAGPRSWTINKTLREQRDAARWRCDDYDLQREAPRGSCPRCGSTTGCMHPRPRTSWGGR